MEDFEICEHTDGNYFCFESGYERCKSCGIIMNVTKEQFESEL